MRDVWLVLRAPILLRYAMGVDSGFRLNNKLQQTDFSKTCPMFLKGPLEAPTVANGHLLVALVTKKSSGRGGFFKGAPGREASSPSKVAYN